MSQSIEATVAGLTDVPVSGVAISLRYHSASPESRCKQQPSASLVEQHLPRGTEQSPEGNASVITATAISRTCVVALTAVFFRAIAPPAMAMSRPFCVVSTTTFCTARRSNFPIPTPLIVCKIFKIDLTSSHSRTSRSVDRGDIRTKTSS